MMRKLSKCKRYPICGVSVSPVVLPSSVFVECSMRRPIHLISHQAAPHNASISNPSTRKGMIERRGKEAHLKDSYEV